MPRTPRAEQFDPGPSVGARHEWCCRLALSRFIQMSYRVVRDAFSVRFLASSFSCIGLVEASRREVQIVQGDCRLYTAQLPLALRGSNVQAELFSRSDGLIASWPTHIGMR